MKTIAPILAVITLAASVVAAADKRGLRVEGRILQVNKPGTILVEIGVGSGDGLKENDIVVVLRKDKQIAKLKITRCDADRSTARIVKLNDGETLQSGDHIKNK